MVSRPDCKVCGTFLMNKWFRASALAARRKLERQMAAGICDACQLQRYFAACEYIAAADEVRMMSSLGGQRRSVLPRGAKISRGFHYQMAEDRLTAAARRCVELGMWPAKRVREETH